MRLLWGKKARTVQLILIPVALILGALGKTTALGFRLNVRSSDELLFPLLLIGVGIFFFFNGFRKERIRRQVENLPTSKVRSMAVGTVELGGWAEEFQVLLDPVYMQPAVYYDIKVQEYRKSGKQGYWKTVFKKTTENQPFYFMDETGRVLVIPHQAELHGGYEPQTTSFGWFQNHEGPEKNFVQQYCGSGFLSSSRSRRLVMVIMRKKSPLYILGFSKPLPHSLRDSGVSMAKAAQELKENPEEMKNLDTNKDGQVDSFEWDLGLARKKKDMDKQKREEDLARNPAMSHVLTQPLVVGKEPNQHFIIADSEKALLSSLATSALWQVILGPVMAAGGIVWFMTFIAK